MEKASGDAKSPRTIVWVAEPSLQAWTCSECEWNYPLPTLLDGADAKSAYDRLAMGKFREHACENFAPRLAQSNAPSFTARIRKLVKQGFKPRDAVDLLLQEVELEYRGQPRVLEQARAEGEDFLRRVREGLI